MNPTLRLGWAAGYTLKMCQIAMARKAFGADDEVVRDMTKEWALGLGSRMQIEVHAHGLDNVDWSKPYVVMANHQSYLDVLALYTALPRCFGIVAKKALFAVPFFGGVMRALGCVPVDRGKKTEAIRAMGDAAELVRKAGTTIAVFPEGTRGTGDTVGRLKKGPFHSIELAQVQTLPVGIRGTAALMPRQNTGIVPGIVEVHIGLPVAPPPGNNPGARSAMMARVRADIARLAGVPLDN